jgi:AAA domain
MVKINTNENSNATGANGAENVTPIRPDVIIPQRKLIRATPFEWTDPATIPPREWLYDHHLIRKFVSTTSAAGGGGKTSLTYAEFLALVTGKDLLKIGKPIEKDLRAWIWNGEDPYDEVKRRLMAICKHYNIKKSDIDGKLFADSGRDTKLKIAVHDKNGTRIAIPEVNQVIDQMLEHQIDVLLIDPVVSFHSVPESDNVGMDKFMKAWGDIADKTNAAIDLAQHVRKGQGVHEHTVEDSRGASSIIAAARNARVVNFISSDEAARYGIDERDRFDYIKVEGGKANMAKRSTGWTKYYKIESVNLGNKTEKHPSDDVGVVTSFTPTEAADSVATPSLVEIAERLENGDHGSDSQANDWAGYVVADVLKLDPVKDKQRIKGMLKSWIKARSLVVVRKEVGKKGKKRPFVKKGTIIDISKLKSGKPKVAP